MGVVNNGVREAGWGVGDEVELQLAVAAVTECRDATSREAGERPRVPTERAHGVVCGGREQEETSLTSHRPSFDTTHNTCRLPP